MYIHRFVSKKPVTALYTWHWWHFLNVVHTKRNRWWIIQDGLISFPMTDNFCDGFWGKSVIFWWKCWWKLWLRIRYFEQIWKFIIFRSKWFWYLKMHEIRETFRIYPVYRKRNDVYISGKLYYVVFQKIY